MSVTFSATSRLTSFYTRMPEKGDTWSPIFCPKFFPNASLQPRPFLHCRQSRELNQHTQMTSSTIEGLLCCNFPSVRV